MVQRAFLYILWSFYVCSPINTHAQQTTVPLSDVCAIDRIRKAYEANHGQIERTNANDSPTITEINNFLDLPKNAAYCGSTIVKFCKDANITLIGIKPREMAIARNWGKYGSVVWDSYNGWRGTKTPNCDELDVLLFSWNGRYHVGVVLYYHGGIKYLTGEGNTSNSRLRKAATKNTIYAKTPQTAYETFTKRQGIYAYKERYATTGLIKVIRYKCKF